jgi:hypothetical protein
MIYAFAVGLVLGVTLTYYVHREEVRYLRHELRVAHAQIAHAVIHERAMVPARVEPVPEPEPLPGELRDIIDEWEDPESRAVQEARVRGWLAEGWGVPAIKRQCGVVG